MNNPSEESSQTDENQSAWPPVLWAITPSCAVSKERALDHPLS